MKITRRQLRRLILQETQYKPPVIDRPRMKHGPTLPSSISGDRVEKISRMIDNGNNLADLAQAQSIVDALGGPPAYAYNKKLELLGKEAMREVQIATDPENFKLRPDPPDFNREHHLANAAETTRQAEVIARKFADESPLPDLEAIFGTLYPMSEKEYRDGLYQQGMEVYYVARGSSNADLLGYEPN